MILNVYIHGRRLEPTSWQETERVITTLVEDLPDFGPRRVAASVPPHMAEEVLEVFNSLPKPDWPYGGTTAEFTFAHGRQKAEDTMPRFDSYLHAAVNARTGYGALKWMLTQDSTVLMDAAIADQVWLSDNPAPPAGP